MLSLILPSKHGGYPGFHAGKLTQESDDFGYADVERHMRSMRRHLMPGVILSVCVIMILFSLLSMATTVIEDKGSNEFQYVMFLCFLSGACHVTVVLATSRAYLVTYDYPMHPMAKRLPVKEYQVQLEGLGRVCLVLAWVERLGLVFFGLSAVYTFYVMLLVR